MLILASNSERRKKLLKDIGVEFTAYRNKVSEEVEENLKPEEIVMVLSKRKAKAALDDYPDATVIAADTMVFFEGKPIHSPKTDEEAFEGLKKMAGKSHKVFTGITVLSKDKESTFYEVATVTMKDYNDIQIYQYIKTKEHFGKAGGYAIQGQGGELVESYDGDFFTIVGLPLKKLQKELLNFDY